MEERAPTSIPALRFDTTTLRARDRFEAWRAAIAPLHETKATSGARDALSVSTTVWNLGGVVTAQGRYSAQSSERSTSVIRRSGTAAFRLHLTVAGSPVGFETGEERRLVPPGGLILTDLAQPGSQLTTGTSETIVLYLARPEVEALAPRAAALHGLMLKGPLAGLLGHHLAALATTLGTPGTPAGAAPALAQATVQLLAAAVSGVIPPEGEPRRAVEDALRRRIAGHIEAHLLDPDLSQERLCRAFHMSRATLYRVMQPLGGVAAYVQERRLARIHAELLDPTRHHHLGRLAEEHGFASQSHMSRAYKARYGLSPSETGVAAGLPPPSPVGDEQVAYERWLRSLGG